MALVVAILIALASEPEVNKRSNQLGYRWRNSPPHKVVNSMQALYKDQNDEALHQRAIEKLARKVKRPLARVKTAYEGEYALLKIDAKVTDFLGIFASRRARDALLRTPA